MKKYLFILLAFVFATSMIYVAESKETKSKFPAKVQLAFSSMTMSELEDIEYSGLDFEFRIAPNDKDFFTGLQFNYKAMWAEDQDMLSALGLGTVIGFRLGNLTKDGFHGEYSIATQLMSFINHPIIEDDDNYPTIAFTPRTSIGVGHFTIDFCYNYYLGRLNDNSGYSVGVSYLF